MNGYENVEICSQCGGLCCKGMPGCAMPSDFNNGDCESLLNAFKSGKWAIDWLDKAGLQEPTEETKDRAYFIRPRIKGITNLFDEAKEGECIFLTPIGCELDFESRPHGCRMLEPKSGDKQCLVHGATPKKAAMAWMPFNGVIEYAASQIHTDPDD